MRRSKICLAIAVVISAATACLISARADDTINFQPACRAKSLPPDARAFTASCEIGPLAASRVARVTVHRDGAQQLPVDATFLPFDLSGRQAAVLFLIDRSDKRRSRTIALAAADALRLAETAHGSSTYRFGLATMLGDRLEVIAPIGSGRDDLVRGATAIRADLVGADDHRALSDAIKLVAQAPGDRHILVVATDGKPEDKSFASDELLAAARNAGVVVVGLGYRERTGDGPELGSLKRLSEETGGFYAEPLLPATRLDDAVIARFGQFAASGGLATFPLDRADPRGKYLITVEIEGGRPLTGVYTPEISLPGLRAAAVKTPAQVATETRPAPGPKPAANTPAQALAVSSPPAPGVPPPEPGSWQAIVNGAAASISDTWRARPLTVLGGAVGVLLIALGIAGAFVRRARSIKVFAWIELLDQSRTRFPVTTPGVRLGRHSDNDIRFRDKSVHRYHALLQREAATGRYQISDVSRNQASSNGVMVNGELVHNPVVLSNGDTIELGEVSFRFVYT